MDRQEPVYEVSLKFRRLSYETVQTKTGSDMLSSMEFVIARDGGAPEQGVARICRRLLLLSQDVEVGVSPMPAWASPDVVGQCARSYRDHIVRAHFWPLMEGRGFTVPDSGVHALHYGYRFVVRSGEWSQIASGLILGESLTGPLAGASLHTEQPQEPYRADPPATH